MTEPGLEHIDEEQAVPVDLGVVWAGGAPLPILLQVGGTAFLAFHLAPIDPSGKRVGIIEWLGCSATFYGPPNDEAFHGHRLWDHGLAEIDVAAEVLNSAWIAGMELANRVHFRHDPARFTGDRRFILPFQDNTFECVADGFRVETTDEPLGRVVERLAVRLVDRHR